MNNIKNIHRSPVFTILVIISTFFGIIISMHFSKYDNNYLFNDSFENSSQIPKDIYSTNDNAYRRIEFDIGNSEFSKYPIGSVPVKVVLGKIKKAEYPYSPRLHLAFLVENKSLIILNDDQLTFE